MSAAMELWLSSERNGADGGRNGAPSGARARGSCAGSDEEREETLERSSVGCVGAPVGAAKQSATEEAGVFSMSSIEEHGEGAAARAPWL